MENASKALIIAGSILIAIMIISLGVLIFNNFGGSAKEAANMDEEEIAAFNSLFTQYIGSSISGSNVNALLQRCLSSNMSASNDGETEKLITVYSGSGTGSILLASNANSITRVTTGKYYTVEVVYSTYGLITEIHVTLNT